MSGIVYVLTNPAMPDFVKIGITSKDSPDERMDQLYTTGVPLPFECAYAIRISDSSKVKRVLEKVERALQDAFAQHRVPNREFFKIGENGEDGAEKVRAILKLFVDIFDAEDVTPEVNKELNTHTTKEERESAEKFKKSRKPNLNFDKMGVPREAELFFAPKGGEKTDRVAKVIGAKKVLFEGKEMSLTRATRQALEINRDVSPTLYWYYGEQLLNNIWSRWVNDVTREVYDGGDDTDE